MKTLHRMLAAHPQASAHTDNLADPAHHLALCAEVCTSCADACLAEPMVEELTRCIRLNQDCADICATTSRLLLRQTATDAALTREMLTACATACRLCAEECEKHANMHEHCRICAEHCRQCVAACERAMSSVAAVA